MKRNINVNISGLLFNIDEDAYEVLQAYLERLRLHFGNDENAVEIIKDIENRIAEMMQEKLSDSKIVITIEDVQRIIAAMGEPGEFDDEAEYAGTAGKRNFSESSANNNLKRKLYRDPDDKVVGGVCSGLGYYFGISAALVRLIFILLTLSGMSVLVYIILWIIIPEAQTTAQKLEMRGEPVNIDNIEKSIREELHDLGNKFNDFKDKHFKKKRGGRSVFEEVIDTLVSVTVAVFKVFMGVIGAVLAVGAGLLIISLIMLLLTGSGLIIDSITGINFAAFFHFPDFLFMSSYGSELTVIGILMVVFIPLIALVYNGIRIISGQKGPSGASTTFWILWITGILILVLPATELAGDMRREASVSAEVEMSRPANDTVYVKIDKKYFDRINISDEYYEDESFVFYSDAENFFGTPRLRVYTTDSTGDVVFLVKKLSRASSYRKAHKLAENISFNYRLNNDTLVIAPLYKVSSEDKWRMQRVKLYLKVPEGVFVKYVNIDPDNPVLSGDYDNLALFIDNECEAE
jgi:phage shock protein PspC (stress-responsive transcriptional regulator)